MAESCGHRDGGVIVVRVEEEFENTAVTRLFLVLLDPGLEHLDCLGDHAVHEEAPGCLVSGQRLVVPVLVEDHHIVDKICLISEGAQVPDLVEIASPDGVRIGGTLDTGELCWVPAHESRHLIQSGSVLLS